jgi:hypothetical protein
MNRIGRHIREQVRSYAAPCRVFIGRKVAALADTYPRGIIVEVIDRGKLAEFSIVVDGGKVMRLSILDSLGNLHAIEYQGPDDGLYEGAWADVARGWLERYETYRTKGNKVTRTTAWARVLRGFDE